MEWKDWLGQQGLTTDIGPYKIIDQIGGSGSSRVFKAHHKEEFVAFKIGNPDGRRDFVAWEAEIGTSLNRHPNIVRTIDAGTQNGLSYVVTEFIDGSNARGYVDFVEERMTPEGAALDWQQLISFLMQTVAGLAHMHRNKIIHNDIKPENLLIDEHNRLTITDFGIAYDMKRGLPQVGDEVLEGTAMYIAPERIGGKSIDPRSDQFSLGVTLYEMMTGVAPFGERHRDKPDAEYHILTDIIAATEPPGVRERNPEVPFILEEICMNLLALHPEQRYPSCDDLAEELELAFPDNE